MKDARIFSFALGNIWRWDRSKNRNSLIDTIRALDIAGVEITLATRQDIHSFKLSGKNELWLKTLDDVSIHAPFGLFKESENEQDVFHQLDGIRKLYHQIGARGVVVHPEPELLHSDILNEFEIKFSIENLPRKSNVPLPCIQKILRRYPRMDLCLDTSHAYSWSKYEAGKLVQNFKERISQIHFSGSYRRKQHGSLRNVSRNFLFSIQPVKRLEVPVVIEEDMEPNSLNYVRDELDYIKRLFSA